MRTAEMLQRAEDHYYSGKITSKRFNEILKKCAFPSNRDVDDAIDAYFEIPIERRIEVELRTDIV